MRPVVVCHSETLGGAELYLNRLYGGLRAEGDEPWLIGSLPGWREASLPNTALRLSPKWSKRTVASGLLKLSTERRRVQRVGRSANADVFHLQFKREQIGFTRSLSRIAPVVWTEHGQFLQGPAGALLAKGYRAAARHVSCIICVSEAVAADVRAVVGSRVPLVVIENAVLDTSARPTAPADRLRARDELHLGANERVALWIGRAHAAKRPDLAVRFASEFDGTVLIAGEGPERARLEGLARGLENVRVLGHVQDPGILFDAADLMFFTSSAEAREGLPTTLIEAAMHELPVLALDDSGLTGLLASLGAVTTSASGAPTEWAAASAALRESTDVHRQHMRRWAAEHSGEEWLVQHRRTLEAVADRSIGPLKGQHE
ncbi:glycosyltransferase [Curtobacterium albidum]|uniref:Glycosyltransferase n=1 Tax=Curtobacterium citreum TaxID=2036 RepID=A0A850DYR5_9MICO|nr:glycosyltransferase [Curtobacterium albidum]NUU29545.1 glycosyltransferase [Curtobacterium albidum]